MQASYRPRLRKLSKRDLADLERRNALVLEHLDWARSIAASVARTLPTWFTTDDLIGPAEIGLVQAAERYDSSKNDSFRAYAQRRVYGACISSIRRREYRERGNVSTDREQAPALPSADPSPEQAAIAGEMEMVWTHVWRLPERHRTVIQRVYGEGMTLVEIAATADIGESRLSQIHREALEMLRELCGEGMRP